MTNARQWVEHLKLQPHPEGGWYRETYRAQERIAHLPSRFIGDRAFSTMIFYLLEGNDFSALHSIHQDEGWHFYDGSSLTIHILSPNGDYSTITLGRQIELGQQPQALVPAGCLFAATVDDVTSFCLVGCTVAPGFEFADFHMPTRAESCERFPQHRELIERLTRG